MIKYDLIDLYDRSATKRFTETQLFAVLQVHELWPKRGEWLAGGALRRTLIGQDLESDFDFFFENIGYYADFVARQKAKGFKIARENELNVTLDNGNIVVQAIKIYQPNAQALLDSFDYTICQFALDSERALYVGDNTLWDLGRKRLAVNKITYPISSVRRMIKYAKQGFTACPGCITELLVQTTALNNSWVDDKIISVD